MGESEAEKRALGAEPDAEKRERRELRAKASLGAYLRAALAGRRVDGPEAELQAAAKHRGWDSRSSCGTPGRPNSGPMFQLESPATVGVNLDLIRPAVFSSKRSAEAGCRNAASRKSGTYASATITTSLSAGSKAKGADAESTAAAFTVQSGDSQSESVPGWGIQD